MLLQLTNITKSFRQPDGAVTPILDVPAYAVAEGEQAVLVGASGGGKTTLLHIIAGITRPDSGQVVLDGVELTRFREATRDRIRARKIGYVFQTFNLLPAFSALENVLLGLSFVSGQASPARARQMLQRVGLGHRLSSRPGTLSVGEQQRVAVARALVNRPRLLLADEPTANVDPANQQKVIDLIRATCREENIALVMVTHAHEVASQFERVDRLESVNRVVQGREVAA
jgi:ABC-type lipoprotein export system ATPase subunit